MYLKNKSILIIIIIYFFITINLIIENSRFYINIINPIFWGCMILFLILKVKSNYIRLSISKKHLKNIFIISIVYILIYLYLGFIVGFSNSPHSNNVYLIIKEIVVEILPLAGIELTRAVMITTNKKSKLMIVLTTILLFLVEINYNSLVDLYSNKQELFKYINGTIIPLIGYSIFYTYLAVKNLYLYTIFFRCLVGVYFLLLPVLPRADWFLKGAFGVISLIILYLLVKYRFIKENKMKTKESVFTKISYIIALTTCIVLVLFMLGVFAYQPITILSNSMVPQFSSGDVVIYRKLNEAELREIPDKSIIVYSVGNQNIVHRVVNIEKQNGTLKYQTKGDSNNVADMNLVEINQIKGIYVFHIKYIGFPSIWLYNFFMTNR